MWATVPLSQPSQDPVEQSVAGAWEGVVNGPLFAPRVPHIAYALLIEQRITDISIACLLLIMATQTARFYSILKQCDTVWLADTSLKPYLTVPFQKKKGLKSTLLSMRLACSKRDTGQNWQPYFSCAVVLIKCLSYQCLTFFFLFRDTWVIANVTKPNCYYFVGQLTLLYLIASTSGLQSKTFFNTILSVSKKWISFHRVVTLIAVQYFPAKARQSSDTPFLWVE